MFQQKTGRWVFLAAILMATLVGSACKPRHANHQDDAEEKIDVARLTPAGATRSRDAVAYVEVQYPKGLRELLQRLSMDPGISEEIRQAFLGHALGVGSGSGVAVACIPKNRSTVVVTNRHVVEQTDEPRVSFDDGRTLARATILYIDDQYDLAVLEVPGEATILPLRLDYREPDEVIAMGFPALGGLGSFQATRGSISNACLREDMLRKNGSDRCWIQHTAAIDPGSSGGPLLSVQNEVIGLNAASSKERHSVFLAVPAQAIQEAVQKADAIRASRTNPTWMRESLQKTCYQFISEVNSADWRMAEVILPALSSTLVVDKGFDAFGWLMRQETGREEAIMLSVVNDPLLGLSQAVAFSIGAFFIASQGIQDGEHCANIHPGDDVLTVNGQVRVMVNMKDGDRAELFWRFEEGGWKLIGFE